tara:strand:- start:368 stop:697 length:330 start_codon:yes stop_codon:yes gene_type:complete
MSFNWSKKEQSIMTSSAGDTNILIEKNREIPLEVKAKMDRRYLPKNLHKTFLEMVNGDSIFLESEAPKRTMHAIRASVSRFYDKIGKDHKLVCQEEDKGVRIFKLKGES